MLSIIIPVYNSAGTLEKCIESVLNQTYKNFNLYLVDDHSTDHQTSSICDKYARQDERVHVLHHEKNQGLSISREDGFRADHSEWVSFIDHDDLIASDMYEEMIKYTHNRHIDMVCIRGEDKTKAEMENPKWEKRLGDKFVLDGKAACNKIYANKLNFPLAQPIWGKLIRRSLVEKAMADVKPYKEKLYWVYFEDVLFTPMLFYHADKVVFDNRLMYMHRRVQTNLSSSIQPKVFHYQSVEAGIEVLRFFERNNLNEAFEKHIVGCFLNMQSIWYKVWKNEKDSKRRDYYNEIVDFYYEEYGQKIKYIKMKTLYDKFVKYTILLFRKHRVLWGYTIGNLYFKIFNRNTYE